MSEIDSALSLGLDGFGNAQLQDSNGIPVGSSYAPATTPLSSLLPDFDFLQSPTPAPNLLNRPIDPTTGLPQNQTTPLASDPAYQNVLAQDQLRAAGLPYTDGFGKTQQADTSSSFDFSGLLDSFKAALAGLAPKLEIGGGVLALLLGGIIVVVILHEWNE